MSFQERAFPLDMTQWVIHLKRHCDAERKNQQAVSTRHPTLRTAQALGIGAITVQSIRAEYRQHGDTREVHTPQPRGTPDGRAAVNLPPVMRAYVRTKH